MEKKWYQPGAKWNIPVHVRFRIGFAFVCLFPALSRLQEFLSGGHAFLAGAAGVLKWFLGVWGVLGMVLILAEAGPKACLSDPDAPLTRFGARLDRGHYMPRRSSRELGD